jgi:hypothetical protein
MTTPSKTALFAAARRECERRSRRWSLPAMAVIRWRKLEALKRLEALPRH